MDDALGHYTAGLWDGEGSFMVRRNNGSKEAMRCTAAIQLRADDKSLLDELCAQAGIGKVRTKPETRGSRCPTAVWEIRLKEECKQLVALFEQYPLRGKKARDFDVWRRAVEAWFEITWNGRAKADWTRMVELQDEMSAVRVYQPERGI